MTTLHINDIEIEVEYAYSPRTFDTREQPGEPASVEITKIECDDILGLIENKITIEEIQLKILEQT